MCDYSLDFVASRPAKVGDKLVTTKFKNSFVSRGRRANQQGFLKLDLPDRHFDGVFANAALFHVPGQELPRVLCKLKERLRQPSRA